MARGRRSGLVSALVAFAFVSAPVRADAPVDPDRFDTVVIDPGHGGEDEGARAHGLIEKELVLDVSQRLAAHLRRSGLRVVLTREADQRVALETRTFRANDARGDLFISVHANSAAVRSARGVETYFMALEASDADAERVAARENRAFAGEAASPAALDPLAAILGDMRSNEHLRDSDEFARLVQAQLGRVPDARSRGVRQAPFVVLMNVQMPASLVEIGFISNQEDARDLARSERRDEIAQALARAVIAFGDRYDARRGVERESSSPGGS